MDRRPWADTESNVFANALYRRTPCQIDDRTRRVCCGRGILGQLFRRGHCLVPCRSPSASGSWRPGSSAGVRPRSSPSTAPILCLSNSCIGRNVRRTVGTLTGNRCPSTRELHNIAAMRPATHTARVIVIWLAFAGWGCHDRLHSQAPVCAAPGCAAPVTRAESRSPSKTRRLLLTDCDVHPKGWAPYLDWSGGSSPCQWADVDGPQSASAMRPVR